MAKKNGYYNRKVTTHDGIGFRSREEIHFYEYLKSELAKGNIKAFEYEPESFVVMEPCSFMGKKVHSITYTPDFIVYDNEGNTIYYEIKGHLTEQAHLKVKLFKKWLSENEPNSKYYMLARNLKRATIAGEFIEYEELQKQKRQEAKNKNK